MFDQDKHGYFETPELKLLMNILHKVPDGETVKVRMDVGTTTSCFLLSVYVFAHTFFYCSKLDFLFIISLF